MLSDAERSYCSLRQPFRHAMNKLNHSPWNCGLTYTYSFPGPHLHKGKVKGLLYKVTLSSYVITCGRVQFRRRLHSSGDFVSAESLWHIWVVKICYKKLKDGYYWPAHVTLLTRACDCHRIRCWPGNEATSFCSLYYVNVHQ